MHTVSEHGMNPTYDLLDMVSVVVWNFVRLAADTEQYGPVY